MYMYMYIMHVCVSNNKDSSLVFFVETGVALWMPKHELEHTHTNLRRELVNGFWGDAPASQSS